MAKKPYKWITEERLRILKEEVELHPTQRSLNEAFQVVAQRLNVTSTAVFYAYRGLLKHYGHIPTLTPGYEKIKKPKSVKVPRKQRAKKTTCNTCSVSLTEENRCKTTAVLCKPCYNAKMREYRKKNNAKHYEFMKSWRAKNKDKVREMHYKYLTKNFGSVSEYGRQYHKDKMQNLTDGYIKMLIAKDLGKGARNDIPQELIDLQRNKVLLIRKIKQSNVQN
jgi:hypothetical protein